MSDTYDCAMCGNTYEYSWSDEMASKELASNFPGFSKDDCGVICDDCYQSSGLFVGPPQDPFKDIPKNMREIMRRHYAEVEKKVVDAWTNHILYGTPLIVRETTP